MDNEVNLSIERLRIEKQDEVFILSEKIKSEILQEASKIERIESLNCESEKLEKKLEREIKKT